MLRGRRGWLSLQRKAETKRKNLGEAIEWNFGHVGNDVRCNELLDELQVIESKMEEMYPKEWLLYSNKYY